jgi:peptide deformylase
VTGFVARVVQHEIDHLNGVLFIDRMTPVRRTALSGRLKRMRRDTRERIGFA